MTINTISFIALISVLAIQSNAALIAEYNFIGDSSDSSGNGINASVFGATLTNDRFGNSGSAYSLDGINDYISIPDIEWTQITFGMWTRIDNLSESPMLMEKAIDDRSVFGEIEIDLFHDNSNNQIHANIGRPFNSTSNIRIPNTDIVDGGFHFFALTADRNADFRLYIDGVLAGQTSVAGSTNLIGEFLIGKTLINSGHLRGVIDDVFIYDTVLSNSEVSDLFTQGLTVPEPAEYAAALGLGVLGLAYYRRRPGNKTRPKNN